MLVHCFAIVCVQFSLEKPLENKIIIFLNNFLIIPKHRAATTDTKLSLTYLLGLTVRKHKKKMINNNVMYLHTTNYFYTNTL